MKENKREVPQLINREEQMERIRRMEEQEDRIRLREFLKLFFKTTPVNFEWKKADGTQFHAYFDADDLRHSILTDKEKFRLITLGFKPMRTIYNH